MPEGILDGVQRFGSDENVRAIVLIGGGRTFIAGADIKEFGKITSGEKRRGPGLISVIEALGELFQASRGGYSRNGVWRRA